MSLIDLWLLPFGIAALFFLSKAGKEWAYEEPIRAVLILVIGGFFVSLLIAGLLGMVSRGVSAVWGADPSSFTEGLLKLVFSSFSQGVAVFLILMPTVFIIASNDKSGPDWMRHEGIRVNKKVGTGIAFVNVALVALAFLGFSSMPGHIPIFCTLVDYFPGHLVVIEWICIGGGTIAAVTSILANDTA